MKLFSWMQNKLNGSSSSSRRQDFYGPSMKETLQKVSREEFSDWPNGFLAIGTLGIRDSLSEECHQNHSNLTESNPSSGELSYFSPEEVDELQKELTKLLTRKSTSRAGKEMAELPLDRFLNCPSSLDVDRRISNSVSSVSEQRDDELDIERTISAIIGKCREISADQKKNSIGKKSISFLLRKMFLCRSGFVPAPSLRDTFQESRIEKLLRTVLLKKIYRQKSSRPSSVKRYLEDKTEETAEKEQDGQDRASENGKWDKTDSEYIVLEI